jgi:hypothetical protein
MDSKMSISDSLQYDKKSTLSKERINKLFKTLSMWLTIDMKEIKELLKLTCEPGAHSEHHQPTQECLLLSCSPSRDFQDTLVYLQHCMINENKYHLLLYYYL